MYRDLCIILLLSCLATSLVVAQQDELDITQFVDEVPEVTDQCLTQVRTVIRRIQDKNFSDLTPALLYSGKNLNDFGSQLLCNQQKNHSYMVMHIIALSQNFTLGVCGPRNCSLQDYRAIEPPLSNGLEALLKRFNKSIPEAPGHVQFVDPEISVAHFGTGTLVTVLMLAFYISCAIIGTAIEYNQQEKKAESSQQSLTTAPDGTSTINDATQQSLLEQHQQQNSEPKRDYGAVKFFKCFSLLTNCEKFVSDRDGGDGNLDVLNAFRFFCILWVVQAHEYNGRGPIASNVQDLIPIMQSDFIVFVLASIYSVDTFFFIGGFLFAYIFLNKLEKIKSFTPPYYIMTIVHRYLRLVPTYAVVLLFYWQIGVFMGSGPVWHKYIDKASACEGMWWSNLLLIDNYFGGFTRQYCFGHGWYMSNDFQIFLIMPALVYMYKKNKQMGKAVVIALIVLTSAYGYWLSDYYEFGMNLPTPGARQDFLAAFLDKYYYKPWTRSPPYLYGCLFGFFYSETMNYQKNPAEAQEKGLTTFQKWGKAIAESLMIRWVLYGIGLFLIVYIIVVPRPLLIDPDQWSQTQCNFYNAFSRLVFTIGLSFLIIGWMLDKTSWMRQIFSLKFFAIMGKLSFAAYLVHGIFIQWTTFSAEQGYYYSHGNLALAVISDSILTFIAALFIHIVIETSVANLESAYLLPPRKPHGAKTQPEKAKQVE